MTFEDDEKALALLMNVGAFKKYSPRNSEEKAILNRLHETGLVQMTGDGAFILDSSDEIYSSLSAKGILEVQEARNTAADYPIR